MVGAGNIAPLLSAKGANWSIFCWVKEEPDLRRSKHCIIWVEHGQYGDLTTNMILYLYPYEWSLLHWKVLAILMALGSSSFQYKLV